MRFFVGEKIPVIRIDKKGQHPVRMFQNYWVLFEQCRDAMREGKLDEVLDIKMEVLEVTEHHKVPVAWREEEGPTADGYLLKDSEGKRWHNQYPVANYGQLDDSNDWRFCMVDGDKPFGARFANSLALFIENQHEQLVRMEKGKDFDQEFYNFLKLLTAMVEKKLLEVYGLVVKLEQPLAEEGIFDAYDAVFYHGGTNMPLNTPA